MSECLHRPFTDPSQKKIPAFRNDSYVEARLGRWGIYQRWLRRGKLAGRAIGLAPPASWWWSLVMQPNVQGRGQQILTPDPPCPVDREEADETTRCIAVLPGKLRRWIVEAYVIMGTVEQQMKALRCCRWTYYSWRGRAYHELLGYFNDVAADVPLPPINTDDDS